MAELQKEFGSGNPKRFQVLAFPCNQFGRQEPKPDADILAFANNKGIDFVFHKLDVNGPDTQPVFKWLKKATNSEGSDITWNFGTYFLVDSKGDPTRWDIATINSLLPGFLQSKLKRGSINKPDDLKGEISMLVEQAGK